MVTLPDDTRGNCYPNGILEFVSAMAMHAILKLVSSHLHSSSLHGSFLSLA